MNVLKITWFFGLLLIGTELWAQERDILVEIPPSESNCRRFSENASWLPDAYIANATCACEITPDETRANRIRFMLQQRLIHTPDSVRQRAADQKAKLANGELSKREYRKYVRTELAPRFYNDHRISYDEAGCEGDPAPFVFWKRVCTHRIGKCRRIWWGMRWLGGSCSAKWGKW